MDFVVGLHKGYDVILLVVDKWVSNGIQSKLPTNRTSCTWFPYRKICKTWDL